MDLLQEVGHRFCDTILDFCDPDQAKVRHVLEELEIVLPKNSDSESSEDSDGESASDEEAKRDAKGGKGGKGGQGGKKKVLG
jgi:hypothetical protein